MIEVTTPQESLSVSDPVIAGYLGGHAVVERSDGGEPLAEPLPVALLATGREHVLTVIRLSRSCQHLLAVRATGPWAGIAIDPVRDWEDEAVVPERAVLIILDRDV